MTLNLRTRVLLSMALVALVVVASIVITNHHVRRSALLRDFQFLVRSAAGTASLALHGDDVGRIHVNDDARLPAFTDARSVLDQVRQINNLGEQEVYILRPLDASCAQAEFVVMLQSRTFVGDRYTVPPTNRPLMQAAWTSGQPQGTGIYVDDHGTWISGYAPVRDSDGNPVAIIEVDAEIGKYLAKARQELWLQIAVGAGAFVIAMIPGLLLARQMTRGLNRLSDGIRRFRAGEHDVRVSVRSGDEISRLAEAFNDMILSLAEKLALLPYVSRFTAEAVRRSRDDPSWLTGSEQDVIVLFADLRGFTSFSEQRDASSVVKELNQLLAAQAEAVISSGGDVDKFLGDAVMAVFMDSGDGSHKAFACAREMIRRVRIETERTGWSLSLGVGIHRGRAVVGSIGSESRRDFTAIGHTVNLASRMCDRATKWEILATEDFVLSLSTDERACFSQTAPMEFKNVKQMVTTYTCKTDAASAASTARTPSPGMPGEGRGEGSERCDVLR